MSNLTRKLAIFVCLLLTSLCFWKAGAGLISGADAEILPSAQAAVHPSYAPPRVVTTPIQEMRPGMRIVGRNPLRLETEATIDPTPEGWRLVSVRMLKADGTYFEAELLRSLSWLRRHQAQPGAVIELNMPELHVVGAAEVLSVSACPPIDPGDGPVVLSTFKNTANNVLNIYVEGESDPIGVTAGHPIWSEDRQAFIHSEKLTIGERLRSAVGKTVRITSIEIRAGPEPVYNLEVAGEHVYSVTDSGLLVHNIGCEDLSTTIDVYSSNHLVSQYDTLQPLSGTLADDVAEGLRQKVWDDYEANLNRIFSGNSGGLSKKSLGPAASVAIDTKTGRVSNVFYNNIDGNPPNNLHYALNDQLPGIPDYIFTKGAGSHAEIYAVNQLLNGWEGTLLSDIHVFTMELSTKPHFIKNWGQLKNACRHCDHILQGVNYIGN